MRGGGEALPPAPKGREIMGGGKEKRRGCVSLLFTQRLKRDKTLLSLRPGMGEKKKEKPGNPSRSANIHYFMRAGRRGKREEKGGLPFRREEGREESSRLSVSLLRIPYPGGLVYRGSGRKVERKEKKEIE